MEQQLAAFVKLCGETRTVETMQVMVYVHGCVVEDVYLHEL